MNYDKAHLIILTEEELMLLLNLLHGYTEVDEHLKERVERLIRKEVEK